ncbi:MAG TPA: hypothetical protein VH796_03080 [Nitrososphaeraceae archaeon]|jgi:hypothetical protein
MTELATIVERIHGTEYSPVKSEIADDLYCRSGKIPGKILAKSKALTRPTIHLDKRVQTIIHRRSEVGPGGIAAWEGSLTDEVEAMGFKWERKGRLANVFCLIGMIHEIFSI